MLLSTDQMEQSERVHAVQLQSCWTHRHGHPDRYGHTSGRGRACDASHSRQKIQECRDHRSARRDGGGAFDQDGAGPGVCMPHRSHGCGTHTRGRAYGRTAGRFEGQDSEEGRSSLRRLQHLHPTEASRPWKSLDRHRSRHGQHAGECSKRLST